MERKLNFISGTVCPANKSDKELEEGHTAIKYYHDIYNKTKKCNSLSIQIKYMGSRLQYYYFHDKPDKCFGVTRNGYLLNNQIYIDINNKIYNKIKKNDKLQEFIKLKSIECIILDGELMPWALLGNNLIKHEFMSVYYAVDKETKFLKESGYYECQNKLMDKLNMTDYKKDTQNSSNKQLINKYNENYETFKTILQNYKNYPTIEETARNIDIFKEQMDIYGITANDNNIDYKAFAILKIITKKGEEYIPGINILKTKKKYLELDQVRQFDLITDNKSDQCIINFDEDNFDQCIKKYDEFYNHITNNRKKEGVVIKPNIIEMNYAPCFKVRNKNYLHIIYGIDYLRLNKYEKLIKNKNIKQKLKLSIEEFNQGLKLLETDMRAINLDNKEYINTLIKFLYLEDSEKTIDIAL